MKRSLIMFGIVFLLMLSIAYAGVLSYYGKIVGVATVLPPTFYASTDCSDAVCKLYINNLPSSYSGNIENVYIKYFKSDQLNVDKWYGANWEIFLKLKGTVQNQVIEYELKFVDTAEQYITICSGQVTISTDETSFTLSCPKEEITLIPQHRLRLKLSSESMFTIYADGNTKVTVE